MSIYRSQAAYNRIIALYDSLLRQWPVSYETRMIATRHGDTHVIVSGNEGAPPLVLLHGAGLNSTMWLPNIAALSSVYRTYCVDIIGEGGKSAPTRLPRKGPEHIMWLEDVLDGLSLDSTHLAGLSLGSWLTLHAAAEIPHRIRSGIAAAPVSMQPMPIGFLLRGAAAALFPSRPTMHMLTRYMSAPQKPIDDTTVDAMLTIFKSIRVNTNEPAMVTDELLCRITCPLLMLIGEYEKINNPAHIIERAVRCIPNVRTEIVRGAGHGVTSDQPETVNNLMLRFLRSL